MPTVKQIVCLANSDMDGGRCVAGKELVGDAPGRWIRPVGEGASKAVPVKKDLKLLDVIDVSLVKSVPHLHQRENWLLDCGPFPSAKYRPWRKLEQLLDSAEPLWIGEHGASNVVNDRIPSSRIQGVGSSLRFILVDELILHAPQGKLRGCFRHEGFEHDLAVTDPNYKQRHARMNPGKQQLEGRSFLTVSLAGDSINVAYYRIIAAILPRGGKVAA